MRRGYFVVVGWIVGSVGALSLSACSAAEMTARAGAVRAKPGEPVVVIINVVKADKKQQFEDYLRKFLAAVDEVKATDPAVRQIDAQTRVLKPAGPNEDGTHSYIFLMDPVINGAEYSMPAILAKAMPKPEADAVFQQFLDAIIEERHQGLEMVQAER